MLAEASPLQVGHLFHPLDEKLLDLLKSLSPAEWEAPTVARLWTVKDVAAHLLDGNIRTLSLERDRYFGQPGPEPGSFEDLVVWLNRFNHQWVDATKRISPGVLILLHEATGKQTSDYLMSLPPQEKAIFPVNWAGEDESRNWLHVARQYTEKWLHQQQIRDAVNKPGIMEKKFFHPFIQTFLCALPHTYRSVDAPEGTVVRITIPGTEGGSWDMARTPEHWVLNKESSNQQGVAAELIIEADAAWKLFSKSKRPQEVMDQVILRGDEQLAAVALDMVAVMA
jgi:uncharacterized protein (TIGR03083 family)